jgi:hypothetical protein
MSFPGDEWRDEGVVMTREDAWRHLKLQDTLLVQLQCSWHPSECRITRQANDCEFIELDAGGMFGKQWVKRSMVEVVSIMQSPPLITPKAVAEAKAKEAAIRAEFTKKVKEADKAMTVSEITEQLKKYNDGEWMNYE